MAATIDDMKAAASRRPTGLLCQALEILDRKRNPGEAERLTRAVLIDVLCERHPEADAAFDAWTESDDMDFANAVQVIITAARQAAA